jgi:hypothetical protein
MSNKRSAPENNPALPRTPIEIDGKIYDLCFDLGALGEAEGKINRDLILSGLDIRVNLLTALPIQNLHNTQIVFAAAIRKFHPEISFSAAMKLLTFENLWDVAEKIREAWKAAIPQADSVANPPEPGS